MHLLGPSLLILEYMAFSDSSQWTVGHPPVLYAWEGACVWIPCTYRIPGNGLTLENMIVYHNYQYNTSTRAFEGNILYNTTDLSKKSQTVKLPGGQERIQFLGDNRSNCTLRIRPVSVNDSGLLGLRMMTKGDKWMENVTLNISKTAPPPYIQLPQKIQESRLTTLTCSLNTACFGYHIGLQWSLEGLVINSTSLDIKNVFTQSQLSFLPQWTHHGKNVTCQLWDHEEERLLSKTSVTLDVKHIPKLYIEVSPQNAVVMESNPVTMTCHINSSNPRYTTVSWLKDGKPLENQVSKEHRNILTLSSVTKTMSGEYQCSTSNTLGIGTSETVTLQVQYPPEPSEVHISPLPVKEGNAVQLTCLSPASPPPTNYSWFLNGKALPERSQNLQIASAQLNHAGIYSCEAENVLGRGQSHKTAKLDVQYPPKEVKAVIQNPAGIREGDDVTVRCEYNSSNPSVSQYKWKSQAHWGASEVLKIPSVTWDAKTVTCAACNLWCSWAPEVNLHVQYAPRDVKVLLKPSPVVRMGEQLLLSCNFSSSHPADVRARWKKNGILLREGWELRFEAVTPEDAGTYHCEVDNAIGLTPAPARVISVLYAPRRLRVSVTPQGGMVEGQKAVLRCESDANPPVKHYAWFDGNNQNLYHFEQTLRLEPVKTEHSGVYWCQGTNDLGLGQSPPTTFTVYYSSETIAKFTSLGLGVCLIAVLLVTWCVRLQQRRKRIQSQQDLPENASGRSFFVRNMKVRRTPLIEGPPSLGCYNPVMEEPTNYAILSFPDTPRNAGTSGTQQSSPQWGNTVTYSVVQKRPVGDYENVTPGSPEDEGIHYSELVRFGCGERSPAPEPVEYVTLKH